MKSVNILGVQCDSMSEEKLLGKIYKHIDEKVGQFEYIVTPNPEIVLKAVKDEKYKKTLNNSLFSLIDGVGIVFLGIFLGNSIKHRITGADLTKRLLKKGNERRYKVLVLIPEKSLSSESDISKTFQRQYKNIPLKIITLKQGMYVKDIIPQVNAFSPDIILNTLGAPKQEIILEYLKNKKIKAKIGIGIGGALDFITGKMKRSPIFLQKLGLEWLWRLLIEPKRLPRILNAVVNFTVYCIYWRLRMIFKYRKNGVGFILNKKGEVLIVKSARYDEWTMPQGGIEKGETIIEGTTREMNEELGIDETLLRVRGYKKDLYSYISPRWYQINSGHKGQKQSVVYFDFVGNNSDITVDQEELRAYKWVAKDKLLRNLAPIRREGTKLFLENII